MQVFKAFMKLYMKIKKFPDFSLGLSNKMRLQDIFYSHLSYDLDDVIKYNDYIVSPISVIVKTTSHKRVIKLNNFYDNYKDDNEYLEYCNISNTYFAVNMLKIDNKLYFTSFNGGKHNVNKKTVSPIDKSTAYNQCLFDLVPNYYNYKDDKSILDYSNKIVGTFWQSTFYNPLFPYKNIGIPVDNLTYKINKNNKNNNIIVLTDSV